MALRRAAPLDSVWEGEMLGVEVGGAAVLLVNPDGRVRAYQDRCLHQGVRLSTGTLRGCVLTCAAHGWQYDVATGRGINPAGIALRALPCAVEGDAIAVDVDAVAEAPRR